MGTDGWIEDQKKKRNCFVSATTTLYYMFYDVYVTMSQIFCRLAFLGGANMESGPVCYHT